MMLFKYSAEIAMSAERLKVDVLTELMSCRWVPGLGSKSALFLGTAEARGTKPAAKFLARSLFSEWLTNEYLGARSVRAGGTRCPSCNSLISRPSV